MFASLSRGTRCFTLKGFVCISNKIIELPDKHTSLSATASVTKRKKFFNVDTRMVGTPVRTRLR